MHEIRLWGPDGSHRRSNQTNHSGASLQSLDTIRITTGLLTNTNVHSQLSLSLALASARYSKGAGTLASLLFLEVCMSLTLVIFFSFPRLLLPAYLSYRVSMDDGLYSVYVYNNVHSIL